MSVGGEYFDGHEALAATYLKPKGLFRKDRHAILVSHFW